MQTQADLERSGRGHWAALLAIVRGGNAAADRRDRPEALWADEALTLVPPHWPLARCECSDRPEPFLYYAITRPARRRRLGRGGGRTHLARLRPARDFPDLRRSAALLGRTAGLVAAALLAVWASMWITAGSPRLCLALPAPRSPRRMLALVVQRGARDEQGGRADRARLFRAFDRVVLLRALIAIFWIAMALQILISLSLRTEARRYGARGRASDGGDGSARDPRADPARPRDRRPRRLSLAPPGKPAEFVHRADVLSRSAAVPCRRRPPPRSCCCSS